MQTQQKQKTAFRARKVTGDFEKQAPEQKLNESQIKKGSIAAIIHFLIRFADGRSLPRIKSSRSRMLCNTFQRRKLKERKEKNFEGHQRWSRHSTKTFWQQY